MRIAIVTTGTTGDVLPYIALGRRLLAAGHEVWLCSADKYAAEAKARGLPFVPCWPWRDERHRELMEALLAEPDPVRHLDIIYGRARKDIVAAIPALWAIVGRTVRQKTDPVFKEALASVELPPERDVSFSASRSRLSASAR